MIPGVLVEFAGRASVAFAATRDARLVPGLHLVCGWDVEPDRETLTCLVARGFTRGLLENLADNRQLAVTIELIGPHETYQFKGDSAGHRELVAADQELYERCRERYIEGVERAHPGRFPREALRKHVWPPALAVRLRVREVFVQTPGPAAGERLYPAAGA